MMKFLSSSGAGYGIVAVVALAAGITLRKHYHIFQPRRTLCLLKNTTGKRKKAMIYTRTGDKGTSSVC